MFHASISVLSKIAQIRLSDKATGVICTDWYHSSDSDTSKTTQIKLVATVKGDVISPEGIDVQIFERKKKNGKWEDQEMLSNSTLIENQILREARSLYLKR
jgi:hypothetical protein